MAVMSLLSIKVLSLSALCVLLTVMAIVMHISRTQCAPGVPAYKPASAVLLTELGKLGMSLALAFREVRALIRHEREEEGGSPELNDEKRRLLFDAGSAGDHEEEEEEDLQQQGSSGARLGVGVDSSSASASMNSIPDISRTRQTSAEMHASESQIPPNTFDAPISVKETLQRMKRETFSKDWLKLSVPAFLFTGQSNLAYYASSNLSVPVFQITYQLKIPATALCSVLMLSRALSRLQWFSIALLSLGVGVVQLATQAAQSSGHPSALPPSSSADGNSTVTDALLAARSLLDSRQGEVKPEMNQLLGLVAVCLACLSSGFASVFFEKQLKKTPSAPLDPSLGTTKQPRTPNTPIPTPLTPPRKTGLWVRNIQLSVFSLSVGAVIYACTAGGSYAAFLQGFTPLVWFLILLQIGGGLLAAIVIQYADNIAKSFSASCSIILSFVASVYLFDYRLSGGVVVGSAAVIGATWLFNVSGPNAQAAPLEPVASDHSPILQPLSPRAEYVPLRASSSISTASASSLPTAARRASTTPLVLSRSGSADSLVRIGAGAAETGGQPLSRKGSAHRL